MPVQLGAAPQADFDQPVNLLMDCHRRIEHFVDVLLGIVDRVEGGPLDAEHREALQTSLTYFHAAAPLHNEDEEHSLFPRMRRHDDEAMQRALAKLDALEADHRTAKVDHDRVETMGRQWLANNALPPAEKDALRRCLERLRALYQEHIRIEDEEIFPLAAQLLGADDLTRMGAEMKERRRIEPAGVADDPHHDTQDEVETASVDSFPCSDSPSSTTASI